MNNPLHLFRWAGSKNRLLPEIQRRFPTSFNGYIEPFAGSASVCLSARPPQAILADANERLVRTLIAVRDEVDKVILHLGEFENTQTCYDYARAQSLAPDFDTRFTNSEIASWLIYLNATCFNGLYRVNGQGYFNVPFGFRRNPTICDAENLRACSAALQNTTIKCADFEETMLSAKPGNLVYCDPPYVGGFTGYTRAGFSMRDQERLRDVALHLAKQGMHVLISNSAKPETYELYRGREFYIQSITTKRSIAANAASRGNVDELLISTYRAEATRAAMHPGAAMIDV